MLAHQMLSSEVALRGTKEGNVERVDFAIFLIFGWVGSLTFKQENIY